MNCPFKASPNLHLVLFDPFRSGLAVVLQISVTSQTAELDLLLQDFLVVSRIHVALNYVSGPEVAPLSHTMLLSS